MKNLILILGCLVFCFSSLAQPYQISIGVLLPTKTSFDPKLKKQIDSLDNMLKNRPEPQSVDYEDDREEKMLSETEKKYLAERNKYLKIAQVTNAITGDISSRLKNYFEWEELGLDSLWIVPVLKKTPEKLKDFQKIADSQLFRFLIGFSSFEISTQKGATFLKAKVLLFDNQTKNFILNKSFQVDLITNNDLTAMNIITGFVEFGGKIVEEIFTLITQSTPNYKPLRNIEQERERFILDTLYLKKPDAEIFEIIQHKSKGGLVPHNYKYSEVYQGFFNENKTQFVAFYIRTDTLESEDEPVSEPDTPQNADNQGSNKKTKFRITREGQYQAVGRKNEYNFEVVAGALYQNQWYLNETDIDNIGRIRYQLNESEMDSITKEEYKKALFVKFLKACYFKPRSTQADPKFWETNFFTRKKLTPNKLKELRFKIRNDKDYAEKWRIIYDLNGEMREEKYIDTFDFIAMMLNWQEQGKHNDVFHYERFEYQVDPLFAKINQELMLKNNSQLVSWGIHFSLDWRYFILSYWVNENGEKFTLKFMVFEVDNNKAYEWNYIKPKVLDKEKMLKCNSEDEKENEAFSNYMAEIIYQTFFQIPECCEGMVVQDQCFWDEYVFKQKNGEYLYLTPIQK